MLDVSRLIGGLLVVACLTTPARAAEKMLFVLDGSGSMWGEIDGRTKNEIAKEVLGERARSLPETIEAGLMVYGHRQKGSCEDIELVADIGGGREDLLTRLARIGPKGKTPIAGSLERAGERLRTSEDAATIVLVSDGEENCGGDPCAVARTLREQGLDLVIHVIGFDVDEVAREQLSCVARAGGGDYLEASDGNALDEALTTVGEAVTRPVTSVTIADDVLGTVWLLRDGEEIVSASMGITRALAPGTYTVRFDDTMSEVIEIESGETREISAAGFGLATVTVADDVAGTVVYVRDGESVTSARAGVARQLPPGAYQLRFDAFPVEGIELAPGETREIAPREEE